MNGTKRIIWNDKIDTSQDGIAEWRKEHRDDTDVDSMSDLDVMEEMQSDCENWLGDEAANLYQELSYPVIAIADLGFWNGRRQGYKILDANLNSFLHTHYGRDEYYGVEYWSDDHNIRGKTPHHDSTHYFVFRQLKGSEDECSALLDAIYNGENYEELLERYTTSLAPLVAAVYGWPVL